MDKSRLDGFRNWCSLRSLCVSSLPEGLNGVYVLADSELIRYPKGKSDILYIGRTDNFRRRIFGNYIGGVGGETTRRIHSHLFEDKYIGTVEVGFKVCGDFKTEEKRLLELFRSIYGEKPKWNKV